jgi:hypothetical protein
MLFLWCRYVNGRLQQISVVRAMSYTLWRFTCLELVLKRGCNASGECYMDVLSWCVTDSVWQICKGNVQREPANCGRKQLILCPSVTVWGSESSTRLNGVRSQESVFLIFTSLLKAKYSFRYCNLPGFCTAASVTHSDLRGRRASGVSLVLTLFCSTIWSRDSQSCIKIPH